MHRFTLQHYRHYFHAYIGFFSIFLRAQSYTTTLQVILRCSYKNLAMRWYKPLNLNLTKLQVTVTLKLVSKWPLHWFVQSKLEQNGFQKIHYPTLPYFTLLSLTKFKSQPRIKFLTLVCLVNIRPKRFSENSLHNCTLLYPTLPTFPTQN